MTPHPTTKEEDEQRRLDALSNVLYGCDTIMLLRPEERMPVLIKALRAVDQAVPAKQRSDHKRCNETIALLEEECNEAQVLIDQLRKTLVEAAIPLEVLYLSVDGPLYNPFPPELSEGIAQAVRTVRTIIHDTPSHS